MAYPGKYSRQYDYQGYQNSNPNRPLPADKVNADLDAQATSSDSIVEFLKTSLRADGAIMNGAISYEQLSASLQSAGLAPLSAWTTVTNYGLYVVVVANGTGIYRSTVVHTSGDFTTDLAAGKWTLLVVLPTINISGLPSGAAIADADLVASRQGSTDVKQAFSAVKTYIQSWITKAMVGLGNVPNVDTTNASNITTGTLAAAQMPALTGDVTSSAGAIATTLATVNSNVGSFGTATQSAQFTVNGKGLLTAAANVTITPAIGSVTGLGAGVAAFLAAASSANLRAAMTDETGTGAAYFQGGDIGTPSAGVATNLTGTAAGLTAGTFTAGSAANLTSGTLPAARTNGHMNGTATNDNAAAGEVGEYAESVVVVGSAVSLTTVTPKDVTTLTLAAGDWDIDCTVYFSSAASTSVTFTGAFISQTLNTGDTTPGRFSQHLMNATVTGGNTISENVPPYRFSLSGSTTFHLVALATFTVSTMNGYGIIRARRVR